MKSILLAFLCLTASLSALGGDNAATVVPSNLPVYVNGQRLEPRDGGHSISLDRTRGVVVDDVVYLPVTKSPPFVTPVKADGMHYAQHIAMVAANAKLAAGSSRDTAKQAMIDAWRQEFGSELTWKIDPEDKYQFILTYHGQSLVMTVPCVADYRPQEQAVDNFESLQVYHDELVASLQRGALVLCGQTYLRVIEPSDAAQVIKDIEALPSQPKTLAMVGNEPVFEKIEVAGGKYVLTNAVIRDLVAHR